MVVCLERNLSNISIRNKFEQKLYQKVESYFFLVIYFLNAHRHSKNTKTPHSIGEKEKSFVFSYISPFKNDSIKQARDDCIDKDVGVLIYWRNNRSTYLVLAGIAQRVLSVPATNTSVERLFSDSGNIVTNRHTRLQTTKVNQLLFIRCEIHFQPQLNSPEIRKTAVLQRHR